MQIKDKYDFSTDEYINNLLKHDAKYFQPIIDFLEQNISKEALILDHGCGTGSLVYILKEMGYKNIIGVDLDSNSIKIGKEKLGLDCIYSISEIELNKKSFDLVISNHVLEHVEDVHSYLDFIISLVKSNGILYVRTPNYLNPKTFIKQSINKLLKREIHKTPFNIGSFYQLIFRFVKSSIYTLNKLIFNDQTIWKFTPLDPSVSVGGDADATWASNYLDIRNYLLKKYEIKELDTKTFKEKINSDKFIGKVEL